MCCLGSPAEQTRTLGSSIKASAQVCTFRHLFVELVCLRDCLVSLDVYALLVVFVCALCLTPVVVRLLVYLDIRLVSSYIGFCKV